MNAASETKPSKPRTHVQYGVQMDRRRHLIRALFVAGPGLGWLMVFLLLPVLGLGVVSVLTRGEYGEIAPPWTWDNYKRLLGFGEFGFDLLYPILLARSILLGGLTTVLCLLAAFPMAFAIAGLPRRYKTAALIAVVVPLWTNLLIRTYAWQIIFAPESWVSRLVAACGIIGPGEALYPGTFAVLVGMFCDFLPFMVLPLYASVEKLDWSIVEAAMDLGAHGMNLFRHAVLPQVMPGVAAGILLVFIPSIGQFVIPDLLGDAKTWLLGNAIQQEFGSSMDWPFGAAMTLCALALVMLALWLCSKLTRDEEEIRWL